MTPLDLLRHCLRRQLPSEATLWLDEAVERLGANPTDLELYLKVSLVPRRLGKDALRLEVEDLERASACRPGWNPSGWTVDQAARVALLLCTPGTAEQHLRRLDQLCTTAEVGELVAFYRGLPLYPYQSQYALRASEGIRTNMKTVFEAVAHRNPYPGEQLAEGAWNQMVLKALFIGSALWPIVGLDARANAPLMRMLCDYAHERWAAGRSVSPELWRCVGPHADVSAVGDLTRVLRTGAQAERIAAALALSAASLPEAARALEEDAGLAASIGRDALSWDSIHVAS